MTEYTGMVVTDGRVLLASEIDEVPELTIIPRAIQIGKETLQSDERAKIMRVRAREAIDQGRPPTILPPQREHFLKAYQALADRHSHIISVHYLGGLDGAAREARICRQLMHPHQHIDVYEAKTLEGGVEFLLKTAATLAQEGASASQLLAFLHYLETHMQTFLLTVGPARPQAWAGASSVQWMRSLWPTTETLWHFDPKQRQMVVVAQGQKLHARIGDILQQRWRPLRYAALLRFRGYTHAQLTQLEQSLQAAGLADVPRREPVVASFIPHVPQTFVEILLLPTAADLNRLREFVQDPVWWKGAA